MDGLQLIVEEPFVFGFVVCFCTSICVWVCLIFWEFQYFKQIRKSHCEDRLKRNWKADSPLYFPSCFASFSAVVGQDPQRSGMQHPSQAEQLSLSSRAIF